MKFCPECGATLVTQKFCQECGADISKYTGGVAGNESNLNTLDTLDFSSLQDQAESQLIEQSGLVIENGVLTGYKGKKRAVVIPSFVEEIFDRAFYGNDFITSVEIKNGATVIGKSAFSNCRYLEKMCIPKSVSRICDYAFYMTNLQELVLDEYSESILKHCISANCVSYMNTGRDISCFIRNENGKVIINIKALEAKANEYITECHRKEEEERKRKIEEQRKAEEKRKAEEEARRKKEEEEARRKAEEAAAKRKAEEEARQRQQREAERRAIIDSWQIGGRPTFGRYRYSDITWLVLARSGNNALVITQYAIEKKVFHNTQYDNYSWSNCDLRKWLNNEFLSYFTMSEREKIISSNGDTVFLLSVDEAKAYFRNDNERACRVNYQRGTWWLRTAGTGYFDMGHGRGVAMVNEDGSICEDGVCPCTCSDNFRRTIDGNRGVRPAMWVNVDKIIADLK